jgi:signal peptidase I
MATLHTPTRNIPKHQWLEAAKTVACGLALALGLHRFVAEVRYIPSESMAPTLQVGDRLIVEKLSYEFHPPQRGDIVVFQAPPELKSQNLHDELIKRIIGLPGDVVQVKAGQVLINGKAIVETYIQSPPNYIYGSVTVPADQYFVLGDNRNHSYDSHFWGFVSREKIMGHAALRIAPLSRFSFP